MGHELSDDNEHRGKKNPSFQLMNEISCISSCSPCYLSYNKRHILINSRKKTGWDVLIFVTPHVIRGNIWRGRYICSGRNNCTGTSVELSDWLKYLARQIQMCRCI